MVDPIAPRLVPRAAQDYARLAWTWTRTVFQYPAGLALMTAGVVLGVVAESGAVLVVFWRAGELAGFTMAEGMVVYGLAASAFGTADLLMGNVERLGERIRSGDLDTMLVRPVSPLVQMATDDFSPRRLGKIVPALGILAAGLWWAAPEWTAGKALVLAALTLSGVVICASVWVVGACLQFFVADARQAANSVTYGGQALTEYPLAVYGQGVVRAVTFTVPLAFVSWQPALYVLDRPDPTGLPDALRFAGPAVAVFTAAVAALAWRTGLRHYRSTGS